MEALHYALKAEGDKLIIDIPPELNGKYLNVIITEDENETKKFHELPVEERLKILQQYTGTAKYPNFPTDKYDVYDQ